ncbi:MAG: 5-deoxy-glucuronate isomerase [Promethearchaeota archaeon]
MSRKVSSEFVQGYKTWVSPETHPLKKIIFGLLSINEGDTFQWKSDSKETAFILLSGKATIKSETLSINLGSRRSVFHQRASAIWIPPDYSIKISTDYGNTRFAVCQGPMEPKKNIEPVVVYPNQVTGGRRGAANWSRDVYDIIHLNTPSKSLVIGETFNLPGNWSSYPPHKHENDNYPYETCFEEVYFYQLDPEYGFGLQRLYSDDLSLDEALILTNGDIVVIDRGYHPVVAAPGVSLYYLWVLAGDQRLLAAKDDPKYAWLHQFAKMDE